jgi:ribosomal protein S18 acetylase RimI-like enzyme
VAADVDGLAAMLARAFDDDPFSRYLMPSDRRRPGGLRRFFRTQLAHDYLASGTVLTVEGARGAAVWGPPGKRPLTGWRALRSTAPLVPHLLGAGFWRAVGVLGRIEELHPSEPHWYLATLGVEPADQHRGLGTALVAGVLEQCDRQALGAYLETAKLENLAFYARLGFEVVHQIPCPDGPTLWTLWRHPVAP